MPSLQERLEAILREIMPVEEEPDGGLTVRHDDTFASLRVVNIVEDLDLVSLTQILAWDLPLTKKVSDQVARHARDTNLGTVTMVEKVSEKPDAKAAQRNSGRGASTTASKKADVMLRYNFPGAGLTDAALRTLILLVLDTGAQIRRALTGSQTG
ncbi:hypothetical protein [Mycobacterium sp.]|uniref:hypothetical protein n=1 Tax=Mycobacterium sp. TaxID=1785 RepID=UPI003F9B75B8